MRILQVHNKYRHYGGEDTVVINESKLLKANGVEAKTLFFDNTRVSLTKIMYNAQAARILNENIKEFKPNVIHVHNLFYKASPSILYEAKRNNIPVVMTLHNFRLLCPGALFLRDLEVCTKCKNLIFPYHSIKYGCFQNSKVKSMALSSALFAHNLLNTWHKKVDKYIVLTPFIKRLIMESHLNTDSQKIIIKPNSTNDIFAENGLINRSDYLYVGRLSVEKGVENLVKAFNNAPQFKLDIIGSGELEIQLKKIANSNIKFHGKKDSSYVAKMLRRTKALIFPSIWYEGLPNTIIEAFSAGTPIIGSNIENINSIIENNYNGILYDNNDPDALLRIITNFELAKYNELYQNARKTFIEKYTHKTNFENLNNIYRELSFK